MATKDPRIDAYIAKAPDFAKPILTHLRSLVHTACPEVEETLKWSSPFFMYKGMLCHMASFKEHCSFGFWKGKLIFGDGNAPGTTENAMGHFGRIAVLSDLPKDKVIIGYIKTAAKLNDDGVKTPSRPKAAKSKELAVPDDLAAALKKNKAALAAFEKFSPSHRREYIEWITEAKREETRNKRLASTIEWLTEGKPRHWKYADC